MQALPVIEYLDVFEDGGSGLLSGVEVVEVNEFILQRTEEALGAGVVLAVAAAAHLPLARPAETAWVMRIESHTLSGGRKHGPSHHLHLRDGMKL